jgi:hypothetical protein
LNKLIALEVYKKVGGRRRPYERHNESAEIK